MCDDRETDDGYTEPSRPGLVCRLGRTLGRWLGTGTGLTIIVPKGTTLSLSGAITIDTVAVTGGTVNYGEGRDGVGRV